VSSLTSNIQKGGALISDTRQVLAVWDPALDPRTNLQQITKSNLLAKSSRVRVEDLLRRIIKPRFIEPGEHILRALRYLLPEPRAFAEACYYETSRDDGLLAAFAEGPLYDWYHEEGRIGVAISDVRSWLADLARQGRTHDWSENVQTKVARGLLAALRDFGVLRGANKKEYRPPSMTSRGFSYVAFREAERGASSRAIVEGSVWRRWLLDETRVRDLLDQANTLGTLHCSRTGSAVRIDWMVNSLEEVAGASA